MQTLFLQLHIAERQAENMRKHGVIVLESNIYFI